MAVQQRLAHEMKIEEFYLATQFVGKQIKLRRRQTTLLPRRLGAKKTIEVTYIGNFKITACNHYQIM